MHINLSNILIISLIILFLILILWLFKKRVFETFSPEEAIENISSLYNKQQLTVSNLTVTNSFNLLPKGSIIAWSPPSNTTNPPDGWLLCDGTNGTPDLRGRFILGSGQGNALTNRTIGQTGGEENHILIIGEMPWHYHSFGVGGSHGSFTGVGQGTTEGYSCNLEGNNKCNFKNNTTAIGAGNPHNNMPPYYVLTFIMRAI